MNLLFVYGLYLILNVYLSHKPMLALLLILSWNYTESTYPIRIIETTPFPRRLHKMTEIQVYKMRIGFSYCRQAKVKGIDHLNYFDIYIIMLALLIGDIESNPGPRLDESLSVSSASAILKIIY